MSLYKNIAEKKARIKAGSREKMRKAGAKGAPTAAAFKAAAKTAKKK
jgi:cysteine sulfinate desulfinase/cysteine desulfurase-like protein